MTASTSQCPGERVGANSQSGTRPKCERSRASLDRNGSVTAWDMAFFFADNNAGPRTAQGDNREVCGFSTQPLPVSSAPMNEFPTPWQRKTMWSALATLAVVSIGAISVGLVWLVSTVIGFLQPILIP